MVAAPPRARIVYDEEHRGWLIEVGPEPGRPMLDDQRRIDTAAEAEAILQQRGFTLDGRRDSEWPWGRDSAADPGRSACVEDWARNETSRVLPFDGDPA